MKRVIIVSILLPCMLLGSVLCMRRIDSACDYMTRTTNDILEASGAGDREQAAEAARLLTEYWRKEENILTHFVRHDYVETLDQCISRLNPLALEGDRASFHAELETLLWHIEDIRRTEAFSIVNIF